ncbi:unnamed protein product, partial [Meganyctiphanes norvegica]
MSATKILSSLKINGEGRRPPIFNFIIVDLKSRGNVNLSRRNYIPGKSHIQVQGISCARISRCTAWIRYTSRVLAVILLEQFQLRFIPSRAILGNHDVLGTTPWWALWSHDFWGSPIARKGSHGSWRPITTLSFRINALFAASINSPRVDLVGSKGSEEMPSLQNIPDDKDTAEIQECAGTHVPSVSVPFLASSFHVVNTMLHGVVTAAYVWVLRGVGVGHWVALGAGSLFAVHPVHVEAVAGVVGRAELLAAIAFCLALGAYTRYLRGLGYLRSSSNQQRGHCVGGEDHGCLCVADRLHSLQDYYAHKTEAGRGWSMEMPGYMWLGLSVGGAGAAMVCKEQGITALGVALVLHAALVICNAPRNKSMLGLAVRELWGGSVGCLLLLWARITIAPHLPTFTAADNPAAHSPHLLTRTLTIARTWALHARLLLCPSILSFDWSMEAVPLVSSIWDPVNIETVLMLGLLVVVSWSTATACWKARTKHRLAKLSPTLHNHHNNHYHDMLNNNSNNNNNNISLQKNDCCCCCGILSHMHKVISKNTGKSPSHEHVILGLALLVVPFLPASNLATYVGFVVAERVLYLPSMGSCLMVALGCKAIWHRTVPKKTNAAVCSRNCYTSSSRHLLPRWWCSGGSRSRAVLLACWVGVLLLFGARTVRRNQDWRSDEALYRAGVQVNPPKSLANLGVIYSEQGRLQEAEWAYRAALSYVPTMADTHYNLGLLLATSGRTQEAVWSYRSALRSRPWLAQAHLALAQALQELNMNTQAQQVLSECGSQVSGPARDGWSHSWAVAMCRQRLARTHLLAGQSYLALEEVAEALQQAPPGYGLHSLHTLAAEAHLETGNYDDARDSLSLALAANPAHVPAHLAFSRMLQANGSRVEEAEQWLRRAVALAPEDPHPHKHLGQLLLEQGRAEEAVSAWLRAAVLDPQDHTAAFNAATALRLAGRNTHAETFYRRAVSLMPKDVSSHRNLGAILHLNSKLEEARMHYEEALRLAPGDAQTTTNLNRLNSLQNKKRIS